MLDECKFCKHGEPTKAGIWHTYATSFKCEKTGQGITHSIAMSGYSIHERIKKNELCKYREFTKENKILFVKKTMYEKIAEENHLSPNLDEDVKAMYSKPSVKL